MLTVLPPSLAGPAVTVLLDGAEKPSPGWVLVLGLRLLRVSLWWGKEDTSRMTSALV